MTSEEYADRVKALVLTAGVRMMEQEVIIGASAAKGLYELAMGGARAVTGKGREHESDTNVQSFEENGAVAQDFLAEARDELTDCAAWLTGASEISGVDKIDRDRYIAFIMWHLALAIDAIDAWTIWESNVAYKARHFIRPEEQHG